ncbi:ostricacin-2-like [Corvus hawaiiensis]|uniref:ostricacin-2-like n=1 Tax=Corvus hawaiiensis TaxID=134902 RepID=UPI0020193C71|nr:ostricacin-2-like [Corvus hawaiiensis]
MRILYLLFPLFLLLVQGAAGSSLGPTNRKQCQKEKGYCSLLNCSFPYVIAGKCSRFYFCCKRIWG